MKYSTPHENWFAFSHTATRSVWLAAILSCLIGCERSLSREKAQEIIAQERGYPKPVTVKLFIGAQVCQYDAQNLLRLLADKGLISYVSRQRLGASVYYDATLTPEGEKYVSKRQENAPPQCALNSGAPHTLVELRLCDEEIGEVTGVATAKDGNSARVEFTHRWNNRTPIAELASGYRCTDKVISDTVQFKLYDDGWRVLNLW